MAATVVSSKGMDRPMEADELLGNLYREGNSHWLDFSVEQDVFIAHAISRIDPSADFVKAISQLQPHDLYLACACAAGNAAAIRYFVDEIVAKISLSAIASSQSSPADIRQLVVDKLLVAENHHPKILDYAGRGPLASWVQVVATRMAIDVHRRYHRESQLTTADLARLGASDTLEFEYLKGRYQVDFRHSLETAFSFLSSRQRALLRMNVVDQLSIAEIGVVYGVHRATVTRWIAEARTLLFDTTRDQLEQRLKSEISALEFEELLSIVVSRLDVSIRRLLEITRE